MTLSISKRVVDVADINVTIHIERMSSAQQTTFRRVLRDGVGTNVGLPTTLVIRAQSARPPHHPLTAGAELVGPHRAVGCSSIAARFPGASPLRVGASANPSYLNENAVAALCAKRSYGTVWVGDCKDAPLVFGKMKLKRWEGEVPMLITVDGDTAARL